MFFQGLCDYGPNFYQVLLSVLGEESAEGALFEEAAFVPGGLERLHLPVVDVRGVPRLGLVVLALALSLRVIIYLPLWLGARQGHYHPRA